MLLYNPTILTLDCESLTILCKEEEVELRRLAKIGKAFEDAKNKEFGIFEYVPYAGAKTEIYPITEYEYNKVIKWAESEKK